MKRQAKFTREKSTGKFGFAIEEWAILSMGYVKKFTNRTAFYAGMQGIPKADVLHGSLQSHGNTAAAVELLRRYYSAK